MTSSLLEKSIENHQYVRLERRFLNSTETEFGDETTSIWASLSNERSGKTWSDLLENDISIVLGTAGSGKTTELRKQVQALQNQHQNAFLIRTEALQGGNFDSAFDPSIADQENIFAKWMRSNSDGFFFIDALDEARLPTGRKTSVLDAALQTISQRIGRKKRRIKLLISSRPSEWREQHDLPRVQQFLKRVHMPPAGGEETVPRTGIYRLAPLTTVDISLICESRSVEADQFIGAINTSLSVELIQQPLDVHFFLDAWIAAKNQGRNDKDIFTSRSKVISELINWRILAQNDGESRSDLDPTRARAALGKLAAYCLLSGLPDITYEAGIPEATEAISVLSTDTEPWTPVETRQLLSCGLFHPSIGGCIRFAHNELRDYLAAEFIDRTVRDRAGSLKIIKPLIADGLQTRSIPQSTERALGWASTFNSNVRRHCGSIRPSLLLEAGDPKTLTLADREWVLKVHASQYDSLKYRGEWFYHEDLKRIATPALTHVVSDLLAKSNSPELSHALIDLARLGKMTGLTRQLADLIQSSKQENRIKADACGALAELGDNQFQRQVLVASSTATEPNKTDTDAAPDWNRFQINALRYWFSAATLRDVVRTLKRIHRERENYSSLTSQIICRFCEDLDDDQKVIALKLLVRHAYGGRDDGHDKIPKAVREFRRFLPAITSLAADVIQKQLEVDEDTLLDAIELSFLPDRTFYIETGSPSVKLASALRACWDIKQKLIDRRISLFPDARPGRAIPFGAFYTLRFEEKEDIDSIFIPDDLGVFRQRLELSNDQDEIDYQLELAWEVLNHFDTSASIEAEHTYKSLAMRFGNKELRKRYGLHGKFSQFFRRVRYRYRYDVVRRFRSSSERVVKDYYTYKNLIVLWQNRNQIKAANLERYAQYLYEISPENLGAGTITAITKRYGAAAASWFEEGLIRFWKQNDPSYATRNHYTTLIGLAGVNLDASMGKLPETSQLAGTAIRHAFAQLNGFPDWVELLALKFPIQFCSEMDEALTVEFASDEAKDALHVSDCVNKLSYSSATIRSIVAPVIFKLCQTSMPENRHDRMHCIDIIARAESTDKNLVVQFLSTNFNCAWISFDFKEAWFLLDSILNVDPKVGLQLLEQKFGDLNSTGQKVLFFEYLGRDAYKPPLDSQQRSVREEQKTDIDLLKWLVQASYVAWPPENDERHEGVYSPNKKDRAEENRRAFLNRLTALQTSEALDALRHLSEKTNLASYRDTFLYQIDQMKRASGRRQEYSSDDAVRFLNEQSKAPNTADEFRALCVEHISTHLSVLHTSDDDEGAFFRRGDAKEDDLRNWLSARLRTTGEKFYSVTRETEVAGAKRPDLYFHSRSQKLGKIPVEIKLADMPHWTGKTLIETPQKQLVGQYLSEETSHSGVYVLVNAARPRTKEKDRNTGEVLRNKFAKRVDGANVTFEELVNRVQIECEQINANPNSNKQVSLVAIDISEKPS